MSTESERKSHTEDTEEFLGVHTCVPGLINSPFHTKILHGNHRLPPYVIATGNGERVRHSLKYLKHGYLLRDVMRALHLNPFRIEIAVGLYKGTPVMIFEHQIGAGATEIYLKELLSSKCMTNKYTVHSTHQTFESDAKYLIRLGTSLGINTINPSKDTIQLAPGDISVATRQVGISSTDFQAVCSNLNMFNYHQSLEIATKKLIQMGFKMEIIKDKNEKNSKNEVWPVVEFDKGLNIALNKSTRNNFKNNENEYGNKCVNSFGNVSKDSLYAEEAPDTFLKLRKCANVGSSDMEAGTIIRTTKQMMNDYGNNIKCAFSAIVLGVLPGNSFTELKNKSFITDVQWKSALDALHEISLKHIGKK